MNSLLLKGGRVLIPSRNFDDTADVLVEKGRVARLGKRLAAPRGAKGVKVMDASGLWLAPGLVDIHTHLRQPGFEYKETIATGTKAAAAGGFTTILCMANTMPVNDNAAVTRFIVEQVRKTAAVKVYPVGAATVGLAGEALSEMVDMSAAGCAAFSDDGKPIMNGFIARKALEYLKYTGKPLIAHEEDALLAAGGSCHEGRISCLLGLRGIPSAAEEVMVARDIALARLAKGRLHLAHLSARESVAALRRAKEEGLAVTAEVTPHHLFLTEEAVIGFDTNAKVSPPLREEADRRSLLAALKEGVIDCIASDHAPHGLVDKEVEFDNAACGISGIETSLPLCLGLVHQGEISPLELINLMSARPAAIMGLDAGDLTEGGAADLVLIDPEYEFTVDPAHFHSLGKNTPFGGRRLKGKAVLTMVNGAVVYGRPDLEGRSGG